MTVLFYKEQLREELGFDGQMAEVDEFYKAAS